jgi:hypothetical protein
LGDAGVGAPAADGAAAAALSRLAGALARGQGPAVAAQDGRRPLLVAARELLQQQVAAEAAGQLAGRIFEGTDDAQLVAQQSRLFPPLQRAGPQHGAVGGEHNDAQPLRVGGGQLHRHLEGPGNGGGILQGRPAWHRRKGIGRHKNCCAQTLPGQQFWALVYTAGRRIPGPVSSFRLSWLPALT